MTSQQTHPFFQQGTAYKDKSTLILVILYAGGLPCYQILL